MFSKRVQNLTTLFPNGPQWKSKDQVPNPIGASLAPFKMNKHKIISKKGLEPGPIFPTWAKVEKQRPDSKPIWDQLGLFQNAKDQNDFERIWNLTPLFPTWTKVEKQRLGSKKFRTRGFFSKTKTTKTISNRFGT